MGFRFLHLADLHLETNFGGRPHTRERLRRATLEAFDRAVGYALDHRLHAVLAAGDLYDDAILSPRTELELVRQVRRLAEAGIWFLCACGNHDPGGPHYRAAGLGLEPGSKPNPDGDWRDRVRLFRAAAPEAVTVTDTGARPVGVVVGAGHASPSEGANLAARFGRVPGHLPVVGLLHTSIEGAHSAESHDRYAPSSPADYHRTDYSYWALGHIHIRQQGVEGLPVFYAGNLQGRNARETGEKGGLLVEAHAGASAQPEFVRLAPVRWLSLRVEVPPDTNGLSGLVDHLVRRVEEQRAWPSEELAVRIELAGATPLAHALRSATELGQIEEELASRSGALEVSLRAGDVALPFDPAVLRESPTVLAEALDLIERARADAALLEALAPQPLARDLGGDREAKLGYLRELLAGLPAELIQRSLAGGEA